VNGGFESHQGVINFGGNDGAWDGWTANNSFGYLINADVARSGSNACYFHRGWTDSSNQMWIEQTVAVAPGLTYGISFASQNTKQALRYSIRDAQHDKLIIERASAAGSSGYGQPANYVKTTGSFIAPDGCTSVKLRIDALDLGGDEKALLDDVGITPPAPPSP
jgi:hypothetical protein